MIIQHEDRNVGPADYKRFVDKLLVTDIFATFQGEGPSAGWPAIFVRLAGCNRGEKSHMGCQFCDTRFHFAEGEVLPYDEIERRIKELSKGPELPLIVLTGGEPMMQDNIVGFIQHMVNKHSELTIEIESNGDRLAKGFTHQTDTTDSDLYVTLIVSPKVGKNGYRELSKEVEDRVDVLKFVISWDPASPYYDLPDWIVRFRYSSTQVYLSPMTVYKRPVMEGEVASAWNADLVDHAQTKRNYDRAAALASHHGFNLSMQKHLFFGIP